MSPVKKTLWPLCAQLLFFVTVTGCAEFAPQFPRQLPSGVRVQGFAGDCRCIGRPPRTEAYQGRSSEHVPTVEQAFSRIKTALERRGIRVVYWRQCPAGLLGQYVPGDGRVILCPQDARGELSTLAHEAGHALVHILRPNVGRVPDRVHEFLAEAASTQTLLELRLISRAEADYRLRATGVMPHEVDGLAALAAAVAHGVVGWADGAPGQIWGVAHGY